MLHSYSSYSTHHITYSALAITYSVLPITCSPLAITILFSSIFRTFGPLFKSQKIIDQNIKRFSKNISLDQSRKIQEQMWSNYGKTFIEQLKDLKALKENHRCMILMQQFFICLVLITNDLVTTTMVLNED